MNVKLNGEFSNNCVLFRNSHQQYIRNEKPLPAAFSPDGGMSTDWNRYTTPEESLIRVGLSKKRNSDQYKDHTLFKLLSLKIEDIILIQGVSSVDFTPKNDDPEVLGSPNNPSHTDVLFTDVELRIKFADIAKRVNVDMDQVNLAVSYAVK